MTLSQTWIVAYRPDGKPQTVESGWQVWHGWGTDQAVPFIYFTTNGYDQSEGSAKGGCYNVSKDCNQFVLYSSSVILGNSLTLYSAQDGEQPTLDITWFLKDGNWWINMNGEWIGYYPKAIFGDGPLPSGGQVIDFGGEATGFQPTSEMGSGRFAQNSYKHAAFHSEISYYDNNGKLIKIMPQSHILQQSMSDPSCYTFEFAGTTPITDGRNVTFFFGGPGSNHFKGEPNLPAPPPEICRGQGGHIAIQ